MAELQEKTAYPNGQVGLGHVGLGSGLARRLALLQPVRSDLEPASAGSAARASKHPRGASKTHKALKIGQNALGIRQNALGAGQRPEGTTKGKTP